MAEQYIGEIRMFGGNFAISGWALCNGQLVAISQNQALFSILGTSYGGNGTQTFALPNLQGRVPIHQGRADSGTTYVVGQNGGAENVALNPTQMPMHTHLVNADGQGNGQVTPQGNTLGVLGRSAPEKLYSSTTNTTMSPTMIAPSGGGQPFSIMQPYLCVTFLIALTGIYPSRN
jgi:microcystin-dependent protein